MALTDSASASRFSRKMSRHMGGLAPATRVRSVKLAPTHCRGALAADVEGPRMLHEDVRQHVRQMADDRQDAVVGDCVDVGGSGAQVEDELLQHGVQLGEGRPGGAEEVGRPVEQVRPRVLDPRVGRAAHGMPADEQRLGQRRQAVDDGRLGAAHVGDQAGSRFGGRALLHQGGDAAHRRRYHHQVGVGGRFGRAGGRLGDDALLKAISRAAGSVSKPTTSSTWARLWAARATLPPIMPTPMTAQPCTPLCTAWPLCLVSSLMGLAHRLSGPGHYVSDAGGDGGELAGVERLRPVGQGQSRGWGASRS